MERRWLPFMLLTWFLGKAGRAAEVNRPPVFTQDMNNLLLSEATPVGDVVYTLHGSDPEGSPIKYGVAGTDRFSVDPISGEITLVQHLDREVNDTLKFLVSIEDQVPDADNNKVQVPFTVIVLDENDNAPEFKNAPYEVDVPENEKVGKTILDGIQVEDVDEVGESLEVSCVPNPQWPEACSMFRVVSLLSTQNQYSGALVLDAPLDYNEKQFYQFTLLATDGALNSTTSVEIKVSDVQNLPPVFSGSVTGALSEDAPVGTLVLQLKARDGDRANPREIAYDLLTNPHDFFLLDSATGELRTAKPLDREALADPSSPLNLTVRAREIVNGQPLTSELTASVTTITVTIKDVNDEPPRFNRAEYSVEIAENLPVGTPLPNLDMLVTDTDLGVNSAFSLRVSDAWGGFTVEPARALGATPVTLRLNRTLDYEDPNQRKFILVVIAEETETAVRLSSKAIVHVSVVDVNDNAPQFAEEAYSVVVREDAARGARVATIAATDRDSGRFGSEGIVYQLFGTGADLFAVDNRTGDITVADCVTNCLDLETRKDYFLNYKATDEDGLGQTKVVSLKVTLLDANDNAPAFTQPLYRAAIDEDATKFEPDLQVKARDADPTSEIRYSIVGEDDTFWIDPLTGKLGVRPGVQIRAPNSTVALTVQASDGVHNTAAAVEILVRDVNNHAPAFEKAAYNASVSEDAPLGTEVARVSATDLDSGANADIRYSIQKGALDAFAIDNGTGAVTVASKLDYDKRNTYRIQIVAADQGMPSLTGTTELTVTVINANDKKPYFTPQIQRAEVSADAEVGTTLHTLVAMDPDITDNADLKYDLSADRALKIVDKNGKEVPDAGDFRNWFKVLSDGAVTVSAKLDRNRAAVMTLPVTVTDTSAPNLQMADGDLIVTIVDVNRHAPRFAQSVYTERMPEEQPIGHVLNTFTATDKESAIAAYAIEPANPYFVIDNVTGVVRSSQRIDYERTKKINFTVVAYDAGVPQLSTSALVLVDVGNANDEEPRFDTPQGYEATVMENAAAGTPILTVHATDADDGPFGEVRYGLTGEQASLFRIDAVGGQVTVAAGAVIDREATADVYLRATAADDAPPDIRKTVSVPVHIKVLDANDNAPVFSQRAYRATIGENVQLSPPAAILHVRADDKDDGHNAQLAYAILEQSAPGTFTVDNSSGIIYPAKAVSGNTTYWLTVAATDRGGQGLADTARVDIHVTSVNQHRPVFSTTQTTIEVPENAAQADLLVTKVHASDADAGDNGRVSYFLKVGNRNVLETGEFSIDETTGEIRTRSFLDREHSDSYQLVVVARDHGSPAPFEELLFLTVVLQDANDNMPRFPRHLYEFSVVENQPAGIIIGSVKAQDKDSGENGRIYYHILEGNQAGAFTLDRTQGLLRANVSFDREKHSEYRITVYASNEPVPDRGALSSGDADGNSTSYSENDNVATVLVKVLDLNDNEPAFSEPVYYAGIRYTAGVGEAIISMVASDPDAAENGTLSYIVAASHLYAVGASASSGSIVPSPFNVSAGGVVSTAGAMAEYNQERFVLDVIAQETAAPFRQARAQLYIWVVSAEQQFRVVVSRGCGEGRGAGAGGVADGGASLGARLAAQLGRAAGARLVPAPLARYVHVDTLYSHWCQLHYHAVEAGTQRVLPVGGVLARLDARYDELRDLYAAAGIETVDAAAAAAAGKVVERFDPALAALIALLIVLFTGIVTFVVVCACLKHWVIAPPSLESSKGDSLARRRILEELSTTENPLWLENKLRPYEEQELTMNVFGDQTEQPNGDSPVDNTYATIAGRGGAGGACGARGGGGGDYATLGADSPTPLEAMLGFQGSTFQPLAPDTPEPPPRPAPSLQNIP